MKLSFSLLLCLAFAIAYSQEAEKTDSLSLKELDSTRVKFYPRAFRIGTDVFSLIKSQLKYSSFSGWELNADVDCGKLYLAADFGSWARAYDVLSGYNGDYKNNGTYWRAGVDINFMKKDPDRNMFFIGFRYGHSQFDESATLIATDPNFGDITKQLSNPSLTAAWGELVTGLRIKMWSNFWMGYTARMKFAPSVKGDGELKTYDIPGYGLYQNQIYWGFNYQVFWNFPFRKQK